MRDIVTNQNASPVAKTGGNPKVDEALADLMACYPALRATTHDDRVRQIAVWDAKLSSVEPEIALEALRWLLEFNPAEPYPPSYAVLCKTLRTFTEQWHDRIAKFYVSGGEWDADWGPTPGQDGCRFSLEFVRKVLSEAATAEWRLSDPRAIHRSAFLAMAPVRLNAIPLSTNVRDGLIAEQNAKRAAAEEAKAKAEAEKAEVERVRAKREQDRIEALEKRIRADSERYEANEKARAEQQRVAEEARRQREVYA